MRAAKLFALAACLCAFVASSAAADGARIVILPVVVHSPTPDPGYVSSGLADMLSARLEQLGGVEVVRADDASLATTRVDEAIEAARAVDGDYVLFGSFTQFGDGASLDIHCAPVQAGALPARNIFVQSGTMGEIIPKLDELADKVARYVRGEVAAQPAAPPSTPDTATSEEFDELNRRLEALERVVFLPVADATGEADPDAEIAEDSPES